MKFFFCCWMLLLGTGGSSLCAQEAANSFKKSNFYKVLAGKDANAIDKQLHLLKDVAIAEKNAYEGALLMKKAGLAKGPKNKLDLFKQGHKKLTEVIENDSTNVEFRFLRLMIQEKSPGILGYKGELERDGLFIRNNFKKLSPVVQQVALDYSKASKNLKLGDL